jgi:branched-chain amino acid transport system ATP-binding protein
VTELHVAYGPIRALRGISLSISEGETIAVVGANGAGKTTLLKALCNDLPRQNGSVWYHGETTAGMKPYILARKGLLHIPEGRGVLGSLSVLENLRLSFDRQRIATSDTFDAALKRVAARFPRIAERLTQSAGSLSGGEQQMLALARAIVNRPNLLLIDEPSLGLSPLLVQSVFALIREFQDAGMTIIVVEQNALAALKLAHRGYVLRNGVVVREGYSQSILQDEHLLRHYLGGQAELRFYDSHLPSKSGHSMG